MCVNDIFVLQDKIAEAMLFAKNNLKDETLRALGEAMACSNNIVIDITLDAQSNEVDTDEEGTLAMPHSFDSQQENKEVRV